MLLELGVGLAQSCSRGVPTQPPVFCFWSLAGEQWGSSLIKQCLREKRGTEKLAIRCDFTGAQEHDLFLSIFIFAWLMSMFLHRKADSQWEGLQYNPFALAAVLQRGMAEAQARRPSGSHPALGSRSLVAFPAHPSLTRRGQGHQAPAHRAMTCPGTSPVCPVSPLCPHQSLGAEYWRSGHQVWQLH